MTTNTTSPRIYVACLAAYNNGRLHGAWIDADTDPDTIQEEVNAMLAASPDPGAEEWAIHDFEGFEGIEVHEWQDFESVASWAHGIAEHGAAYAAWVENDSHNIAVDDFEDAYQGEWDSLTHYAEDFADSIGMLRNVPAEISMFFDFEAYGEYLDSDGSIWTTRAPGGSVFVFLNI